MLNFAILRISLIKLVLVCTFTAVLTVFNLFKSVIWINEGIIKTLDWAENSLDRLAEHELVKSIFKYKFVQGFSVFLVLSALFFGFMIKVSDALVVEAQGRYIAEQKFMAQMDKDTPDDIFFKKNERLNE